MADIIQQRRDTAARWAQYNPILLEGEVGYVTDNPNQYKIGNGRDKWNDLPLRGYNGTITQEKGNDENAVMSQAAVTKELSDLGSEVGRLEIKEEEDIQTLRDDIDSMLNKENSADESEEIVIMSENGEVIVKVYEQGVDLKAAKVNGHSVITDEDIVSSKTVDESIGNEEILVETEKGEQILKLTEEGLRVKSIKTLEGKPIMSSRSWLFGKRVYTLGDSLSEKGKWQGKLCELTGCIYDSKYNYVTNKGGSMSFGINNNGGSQRALNLSEIGKSENVEVIFVQNVNDGNMIPYGGSSVSTIMDDDFAYMPKWDIMKSSLPIFCREVKDSIEVFSTMNDAIQDFKNNILSRASGLLRHRGATYNCRYGNIYKSIKITSKATTAGSILITVGGKQYGISVTTSDTIEDICKNIEAWDYSEVGYSDKIGSDNSSVMFSDGSNSPLVSFNGNGTGVSASISDIEDISISELVYVGNTMEDSDWTNPNNWIKRLEVNLFSIYKGFFEFLQKEFPYAVIIMLCLPSIGLTSFDDVDVTKELSSSGQLNQKTLRIIQKKVAELYGIKVVDVASNGQVSPANMSKYFPIKNVHPLDNGYDRWAETIARELGCL